MESARKPALRIAADVFADLCAEQFEFVAERMSPHMRAGLPTSELARLWRSLIGQFGSCVGRGEPSSEEKAGFTVVRVPMKFAERALDLKVSLASGQIVGLFVVPPQAPASAWLPPAYVDPETFAEIELQVGAAPKPLPGTLSLPKGVADAPAAVLVHGSGPQDRDERLGPNRPFRDLAAGLATRGVAVLRYDKRTRVYPDSFAELKAPTVKDEALDDVGLAIEVLRSRPEVDRRRIAVVGHSLGGTLAPRIASSNPAVTRIVILAGATRPLPEVAIAQVEYLARLKGPLDAAASESIERLKVEAARTRAALPGDEGPPFLGAPLSWWADLNGYDPAETAAALSIPMLILQGGRDYQVTEEDFDRFRSALEGRANAFCRRLPRLNHQFIAGTGPSAPTEYETPGHFDAEAVDMIARFLLAS